jgi:tRNA(Ile)-lysidine synthase
MEKAFKNTIKADFPYLSGSRLLLAVSGGLDSVVLAHLCRRSKLDFALAHCNYNLRAEESDEDERFVRELAETLEAELFTENFDTLAYAEEERVSVQMAARELRYSWFQDLAATKGFDYVLTAHHANDDLETFLINLVRGTGLEGFTGIKSESRNLVRPLLACSRKEIEGFATANNISWRDDSSNRSSKYLRTKIRHEIVPVLEEINPQILKSFRQTQSHLRENFDLVEDYTALLYGQIVSPSEFGYQLDIAILEKIPNTKAVLYQLLKAFAFTEWDDVYNLLTAQPGKVVFSPTHRLIKDRDVLILTKINIDKKEQSYSIPEGEEIVMLPVGTLSIQETSKINEVPPSTIYVAKEKLKFPLELRKWQKGDYFYPLGMKGKKKLSDFFKDKKLSLPQKENCWLLCSGDEIVWVVNYRADARFSITDPSQQILKISYSK